MLNVILLVTLNIFYEPYDNYNILGRNGQNCSAYVC